MLCNCRLSRICAEGRYSGEVLENTQALNEGKPKIVEMVEGRMRKYYETVCLLEQPHIREPEITVNDLIVEQIADRENIKADVLSAMRLAKLAKRKKILPLRCKHN